MTPTPSVRPLAVAFLAAAATLCQAKTEVTQRPFGSIPGGAPVTEFVLKNDRGLTAHVIEYGAILAKVEVPDAKNPGKSVDLTLGYDDLPGWLGNSSYFGASVGRFGNRIGAGKFTLDGKTYQLATNNSPGGIPCHLHGGVKGFDKVLWKGEAVSRDGASGVKLSRRSPAGEEGYPGNLDVSITYWVTDKDELIWDVEAKTDAPTLINPAHHTYWNLTGDAKKTITEHVLSLNANWYLPTDAGLIPTGEILKVEGTPMDFRKPMAIGTKIGADFEALKFGGGYDHAWVLSGTADAAGLRHAATVADPSSGRSLTIYTNQPAIQFYSGNFLDGTTVGKKGVSYAFRTGLCLETEGFPDAPNKAHFPSTVLRPGQTYHHLMVHQLKY